MSAKALEGYVVIAFVVVALLVTYFQGAAGAARNRIRGRRARRRTKRAELAAVEASLDDAAFDPAHVHDEVESIFVLEQRYRTSRDPAAFQGREDAAELTAWAHRLTEWFDATGELEALLDVKILGVVNRPGTEHDSVEAWVRIGLRGPVTSLPANVHRSLGLSEKLVLEERWMLGRRAEGWALLQTTGDPRSPLATTQPLIANAWDDEEHLRGESLREIATGEQPAPPGIADGDLSPALQLQDLAVADDRFSPAVVEAVVDRLLEAWEDVSRGRDDELAGLATPEAAEDLVHPPGLRSAFMIVRDIQRTAWEVTAVRADTNPPQIDISVRLTALRHLVDDATRDHVAGSVEHRHEITLDWQLRRVDDEDPLWQLAATSDPASGIAGISDQPLPRPPSRLSQLLQLIRD